MLDKIKNKDLKIGLIGLGYVGLPLAAEFGKYYDTIGFDVKKNTAGTTAERNGCHSGNLR